MRDIWLWLVGLIGVGGVAGGVAFWALGGPALLRIADRLLDAVVPLLKAAAELAGDILKGLGGVLLTGVKNILSQSATLGTVILMGLILWGGQRYSYERLEDRLVNRQAAVNECYAAKASLERRLGIKPGTPPVAGVRSPFPLPWQLF